jgi:phage terminase large subunit
VSALPARLDPFEDFDPFGVGLGRGAMVSRAILDATRSSFDPHITRVKPLVQYQMNPVGFFTDVLGIPERTIRWSLNPGYDTHQWDGTVDPLIVMLEALANSQDVAVEAGTGTQKSHTAAGAILWFNGCWEDSRVFTFAPKEDQLRLYIWKEIGRLWPRFQRHFPAAVLSDLTIRMRGGIDDSWGARGYAVGVKAGEATSTKAQGMHAEHMMLVYEETPGIPSPVIEAGENTATAPHNIRLAVGNPDHQLDALHQFGHDTFGAPRPGVINVQISALDHPNLVADDPTIVPGAASWKSEKRRREKYGEDSRLYKTRIRGMSPAESVEALIKLEWVQSAQKRWLDDVQKPVLMAGKRALGVDVANSLNGDDGAIARGQGAYCESVTAFPCPNANDLGFRVHLEMDELRIEPEYVGVDSVGVGVGTVNELRKRDKWIRALNGAESPIGRADDTEDYNNLRSQMYWQAREDLRLGLVALPADMELATDLITPQWKTANGNIVVESKEDLKKRLPGGRSTNKGDAFVYWNWVRERSELVSRVPVPNPSRLDRIKREIDSLARADEQHEAERRGGDKPYGGVLRQ